jgi:hypothetical protein
MPHIVPAGHRYYHSNDVVEEGGGFDEEGHRVEVVKHAFSRRRKDMTGQKKLCEACFKKYEAILEGGLGNDPAKDTTVDYFSHWS